jgi:tetratricopeptide (TPR) repeat protein
MPMADLDQLKRAMHDSSELWKAGEPEKALELLDNSISAALQENRSSWIRTLSHHAAVIAGSEGNLGRVKHYYEQSLAYNPGNPPALYGLAKVLFEQGETELAKRYATECREAALGSDDEIDRGILELIAKKWPELGPAGEGSKQPSHE